MSREPKFRVWHKHDKKMYSVKSLTWFDKEIDSERRLDTIRVDQRESSITTTSYFLSPDNVELMQFTGLIDEHGREVYERDILRMRLRAIPDDLAIQIDWDERRMGYLGIGTTNNVKIDLSYLMKDVEYYEVIGNIYEHPELMRGGKHEEGN